MSYLANAKLRAAVSDTGRLLAIENHLAGETYAFTADCFILETDQGRFSNQLEPQDNPPAIQITQQPAQLIYHFTWANLSLALVYTLDGENAFLRRSVSITNSQSVRLLRLTFGQTAFQQAADDVVHYLTFWMAPTVEFIRYPNGGLFTGIENPFYQADLTEQGVTLGFEPGLILQPGEGYTSEPQFIGVYKKSGVMIEDSGRPFRYPNGSGYIPIDRNESRAMRAFALDYLQPAQRPFLTINYQFFHPLPQIPSTDTDKAYFIKTIDTFADIGGDMLIFKPLHRHRKPDAATPYWNVLPDDESSIARQIADYARQKGIAYGFYLGIAGGHGQEGNSAGLAFRPEEAAWKKMDAAGRRAPDNCIGSDDFYEWWYQVHDNTIKRYQLSNWSWDPNVGSATQCHDESHGHIAGQGTYKGWRRCMELTRRLTESNPGLFIQGFYGTKHFGLWGLRGTDQHEVYNEQTSLVCTHHTQISDDRQNADGLRFQNYWSMRFRFLPTQIGHALVHRMSEGEFDPELIKAWDFDGWRYGLLSALAVSGSLMPAILPIESGLVPGYAAFYHKWRQWAQDHLEYVPYTEPFGEQVQPGCIDGYARIKADHGFIFLFNGNPRPATITFEVGDEINLQVDGHYELVTLYPTEGQVVQDDQGRSRFARGDSAQLTLPANQCLVLELRGTTAAFNAGGDAASLLSPTTPSGNLHALDDWQLPDGRAFDFPYHPAHAQLTVRTAFNLDPAVVDQLAQAKPRNSDEVDAKIAHWQASNDVASRYHNFIGSRPHRLWLVIPFTLQKSGADRFAADFVLRVALNHLDISGQLRRDDNGNSFYADITDLVKYGLEAGDRNHITLVLQNLGPNEFMGPFLIYPDGSTSPAVSTSPATSAATSSSRVVYTRPIIPTGPARHVKGGAPPRIMSAETTGPVTLTRPTQLRVQVDQPPSSLQAVCYTQSGFPWMGQAELTYDADLGCWTTEIKPGGRATMQESEYVHVWAVGRDGLHSDYRPVKIGWNFTE